jgi:hypothetical protein
LYNESSFRRNGAVCLATFTFIYPYSLSIIEVIILNQVFSPPVSHF